MPTEGIAIFKSMAIKWTRRTSSLMLTTLLLTACTQFSPSPGTGEKPIPPTGQALFLQHPHQPGKHPAYERGGHHSEQFKKGGD